VSAKENPELGTPTTPEGFGRVASIDQARKAARRRPAGLTGAERRLLLEEIATVSAELCDLKDCHVFTTGFGEPIYPDTVTALPRKLINAYNHPKEEKPPAEPLPYARLHDLRHIHATTLLLAGVPVHVVAARLGHADPAITLRVYAHVVRSAETAAADVFAKAIKAA
jgi:integrase